MREAGGKRRHRGGEEVVGHVKRVMRTSVNGYATSGLVHIGHRREGGLWGGSDLEGWVRRASVGMSHC